MVRTFSSMRHFAALTAWLVTIAACLALLLPSTGSLNRLLPTLASINNAFSSETPTAVSSLQPNEHFSQLASVVPPSLEEELEVEEE